MSVSYSEGERQEVIDWLRQAVQIPSINPPGQEEGMMRLITSILEKEGITYTLVEVAPKRANILARLEGEKHDSPIIFTGHMDVVTVSEKESLRWHYDPFGAEIVDGIMYGRGTSDMKSGLMGALYAMVKLKREGIVPAEDILFVATVDEESDMLGSKALVDHEWLRSASYSIICEPTNFNMCIEGKGRTFARVSVKGRTAHGSMPSVGSNAIYSAIDLIEKIRAYQFPFFDPYDATFWRVLEIFASVEPMVVPDECRFTIDCRMATKDHSNMIWAILDNIIAEAKAENPHLEVDYSVDERREPWVTPKDADMVQLCDKLLTDKGMNVVYDRFQGSTDGSYLRQLGCKNIIIGPGDLSIVHQENEHVSLEALIQGSELYFDMMSSYKR